MPTKISSFLAAILLSGAATLAHASTVLDFNDLPASGDQIVSLASYQNSSYQVSATQTSEAQPGLLAVGSGNAFYYAGSASLALGEAGVLATLARTDGGAFDLLSIDLASLLQNDCRSQGCSVQASFTGYLADGGTVLANVLVSDALAFSTYQFSGFENLLSVTWTQNDSYFQFDNIVLNQPAQVPEPAPLLLLGFGLAGLLAARRMRRSQAR